MKIILETIAALLIGAVATAYSHPAAAAQSAPQGSYLTGCTNVEMRGATLTATCRTLSGKTLRTVLNDVNRCIGDITNNDGVLQCQVNGGAAQNPSYGQQPAPPGYAAQPPAPGYAGQPPAPGYAAQPPTPGYAGQPPAPGYAGQPPAPGYAGQPPAPGPAPGYAGQPPAPGYAAPPPPGYGAPHYGEPGSRPSWAEWCGEVHHRSRWLWERLHRISDPEERDHFSRRFYELHEARDRCRAHGYY